MYMCICVYMCIYMYICIHKLSGGGAARRVLLCVLQPARGARRAVPQGAHAPMYTNTHIHMYPPTALVFFPLSCMCVREGVRFGCGGGEWSIGLGLAEETPWLEMRQLHAARKALTLTLARTHL